MSAGADEAGLIFLDTLSPEDGAIRPIAGGGVFQRPPPVVLEDCSEDGTPHLLGAPREIPLAATSLVTLRPGARVVSSYAVQTPSGAVMLPRGDRALVADYRAAATAGGPPAADLAAVGTGLDWFADGQRMQARATRALDGDVFWAGPDERDNWGVWLMQTLPTLAWAEAEGVEGRLLCHAATAWQRDLIALAAPRLSARLVPQDQGAAYAVGGRLGFLAQNLRNLAPSDFERTALDGWSARVADGSAATPERIFVSRLSQARRHPDYRVLRNEAALIAALEAEGLTAVEPETLPFSQQVALFARARQVAGLGGAGMFNAVFCRPGTPVLTIESSAGWIEAHANLFAGRGLPYGVVFGRREGPGSHAPWSVPVETVVAAVRRMAP